MSMHYIPYPLPAKQICNKCKGTFTDHDNIISIILYAECLDCMYKGDTEGNLKHDHVDIEEYGEGHLKESDMDYGKL